MRLYIQPEFDFSNPDYPSVRDGLAVTPAQALKMAREGHPITLGVSDANLFDNVADDDFTIPVERRRGSTIIDAFEAQAEATAKITPRRKSKK
ncbi:hypothetical protein [Dipodfec virus UOA04_Rod_623]|nr:hypothetical protein [Dipodfec virus UOA04_Rod_623]